MKNIIVVCLVSLMMSALCEAQIVKVSGNLRIGYNTQRNILFTKVVDPPMYWYDQSAMYGKLFINLNYKSFDLYTSNKTYFNKDTWRDAIFNPIQSEFVLGASYKIKSLSFNWEHLCSHSIEGKRFSRYYDDFGVELKF